MCQINYGCKIARSHLLQSCDYQTFKSPLLSESLLIKTQSMLSLGFEFQETNGNSFEVTVHHSLKGWVFRLSLSTCAFECIYRINSIWICMLFAVQAFPEGKGHTVRSECTVSRLQEREKVERGHREQKRSTSFIITGVILCHTSCLQCRQQK